MKYDLNRTIIVNEENGQNKKESHVVRLEWIQVWCKLRRLRRRLSCPPRPQQIFQTPSVSAITSWRPPGPRHRYWRTWSFRCGLPLWLSTGSCSKAGFSQREVKQVYFGVFFSFFGLFTQKDMGALQGEYKEAHLFSGPEIFCRKNWFYKITDVNKEAA